MQHPNYRGLSICLVALIAAVMVAAPARAVAPDPAFLVKDIALVGGGNPQFLRDVGGTLYFSALGALWQSDGTDAGTIQVSIAGITNPFAIAALDGLRIVFADAGGGATNMYAYDPITTNVTPLKSGFNLRSSPQGSVLGQIGAELFFMVAGSTLELWKTDGTVVGTVAVATVNPTTGGTAVANTATVGDTIYFVADNGVNGYELWKTDGTTGGTALVKDIAPTGDFTATPGNLTPFGTKLLFTAGDGTNGRELWVSDGTAQGTTLVSDIAAGSGSTFNSNTTTSQLATAGGYAYFFSAQSFTVEDLWRSDGTAAGTTLVKDFAPSSFRANLIGAGPRVYFTNDDGSGVELWTSDGTSAGTLRVQDTIVGPAGAEPNNLANIDGTLVYAGSSTALGKEVWRSNGTDAGTLNVADVNVGSSSSDPREFTVSGGLVFFSAEGVTGNRELWAMPFAPLASYKAHLPLITR